MKKTVAVSLLFLWVSISCVAQQRFGGIGAQLFLDTMGGHTMPCIQGLVPNSSADEHLRVTDFIIKVNGVSCLDKSIADVVSLIRGEVGTTVQIIVADTKEGKNPRTYDLDRRMISTNAPAPAPSVVMFSKEKVYDSVLTKMKKNGCAIIKTFPTDCGDYFFNFDAEAGIYHIRVITISDKDTVADKAFYVTARVFDNANEAAATTIQHYEARDGGSYNFGQLDGTVKFEKNAVGVVSLQRHNNENECSGMYVIIYK